MERMNTIHKTTEQFLSRKQLQRRWSCCIETIKRRQRAGVLTPIYLSARMVRYALRNIEEVEAAAGHE